MEPTRKQELLNFIPFVPEDQFIGVYYIDKDLGIVHYSIYNKDTIDKLKEKLENLNSNLEDDLLKVISWRSGESEDYLIGVYDGIVNQKEQENKE